MGKTAGASSDAGIATVYRALDGALHHKRCGSRIVLGGPRAGALEVDFYCRECAETVTLPFCVLARIPVADRGGA